MRWIWSVSLGLTAAAIVALLAERLFAGTMFLRPTLIGLAIFGVAFSLLVEWKLP